MSIIVMSSFAKFRIFQSKNCLCTYNFRRECSNLKSEPELDQDEFRTLDIRGVKKAHTSQRKRQTYVVFPPRSERMAIDQDWTSVWPGPRTFHPASVPLPLRQGINKLGASPGKIGNVELMKIPNFLHLTPPAIKKHCMALKKFCTPWPKALDSVESCRKHFPLDVIQTDYCQSSPTIRNPMARIVTIKFPLNRLELDGHARDKFLRLAGDRYDEETGIVTIVTDKCPLRKQNYDYAMYLLTALFYESWTYEDWEKEKSQADLEYFDWDNSKCHDNIKYVFEQTNDDINAHKSQVEELKKSAVALFDDGENEYNLKKYKEAAIGVLFPSS